MKQQIRTKLNGKRCRNMKWLRFFVVGCCESLEMVLVCVCIKICLYYLRGMRMRVIYVSPFSINDREI